MPPTAKAAAITVEWHGLDGLEKALTNMPEVVAHELETAQRLSVDLTRAKVIEAAPRAPDLPSRLPAGVVAHVEGSGADTKGEIRLQGVAVMVAQGTRPHEIEPRRGRALRWAGDQYAPRVRHRGARSNDYFDRGIDAAQSDRDATAERVAETVVQYVGREIDRDGGK